MSDEVLALIEEYWAANGNPHQIEFNAAARWFIDNGYELPRDHAIKAWKERLKHTLKNSTIVARGKHKIRRWYALPSGMRVEGFDGGDTQQELWVDFEYADWSIRQRVLESVEMNAKKAAKAGLRLLDYANENRKPGQPEHQVRFSWSTDELREDDDEGMAAAG